jgi:hypothetical protein
MVANSSKDPQRGRGSVVLADCHIVRLEVKIRKPEKFGLWLEFLLKLDELNMWLLSRAMGRWQMRQFKRELKRQKTKWN